MTDRSTKSNFALRIPASLKKEAEKLAAEEGTTLNTLISIALAEKVSTLRTAEFFAERSRGADVEKAKAVLAKSGKPGRVRKGDEV